VNTKVVGMRVMRGPDWKWGDQDGGMGSIGTVTDKKSDDGWVSVKWDSNSTNNYRIGGEGKFDLVEVASTATVASIATTVIPTFILQ
jgi:hypothetical protein